jgi:hypothetical protein
MRGCNPRLRYGAGGAITALLAMINPEAEVLHARATGELGGHISRAEKWPYKSKPS